MPMPFSTTYDYPDWTQADGISDAICSGATDGLSGSANDYPNGNTSFPESITADANYSAGGGSKGQRHWFHDSNNAISGGTELDFGATYSEFWVRVYIRFQSGFSWGAGNAATKLLYPFTVGGDGTYCAPGYHDGFFGIQSSDVKNSTTTWSDIMGGATSDGQFHCYEWHVKADTDGSNGIAQGWIDDVEVMNITNANWGTPTGWEGTRIGENHGVCDNANGPIGSEYAYIDFDDFAVSATARIGPLSGGGGGGPVLGSQLGGLG